MFITQGYETSINERSVYFYHSKPESMRIDELMNVIHVEFDKHQNPEKAISMANYLKNKFVCFGIKTPIRNEIQKEWFPLLKKNDVNHWDIVYHLWSQNQREYQYVAVDLLKKVSPKQMLQNDHLNLEEVITTKPWWDTVDLIASNYVGKYFQQFPNQISPVIEKWRNHHSIWLNRTCLIFQLKYKDETNFELLKDLIIQYQGNPEFFIQKAIGWSLRQYSKFQPEKVRQFIQEQNIEGLAKREASKYL